MGAADTVPGVSGGTIAFISGIYEELISSIRSIDRQAVRFFVQRDIRSLWDHINGRFLVVLFSGILLSIACLSRVILYILNHYPVLIWSFFFGLIVASAFVVTRKITKWSMKIVGGGIAGLMLGYYITVATPAETTTALWFVFLSGMIAICAMILPGISGSFILVLLSKYEYILHAVKDLNIVVIITFAAGTACGLLSFSHLLHWMLKNYYNLTVSFLTGIMIGSLNKVWPWKQVVETFTSSSGRLKPLVEHNVLPTRYLEVTGNEPYLFSAIALAIVGFAFVYYLERLSTPGK